MGAGQPGGRHRHGRLRVRPGPRPLEAGAGHAWCRTRVAPATARPAPPSSYAEMYGPLLDRRNLLLVDQRGTGRSEPIDCPPLQDLKGDYAPAAAACGAALGARADDYSTALSADDLAAVVDALGLGPVDVYGDSYGTFFAQVYAGRHPEQVRSVVLDSAYPTYGEDAWYATQGPAMRDVLRARLPADPCLPGRRPAVPAHPGEGARGGARRSPGAARRTTRTAAGCGSRSTARGWSRSPSARRTRRRSTASSPRRCGPGCPATAGRCSGWSPRRPVATPTPGRSGPTARGSTPPSPATTTPSSTT